MVDSVQSTKIFSVIIQGEMRKARVWWTVARAIYVAPKQVDDDQKKF